MLTHRRDERHLLLLVVSSRLERGCLVGSRAAGRTSYVRLDSDGKKARCCPRLATRELDDDDEKKKGLAALLLLQMQCHSPLREDLDALYIGRQLG